MGTNRSHVELDVEFEMSVDVGIDVQDVEHLCWTLWSHNIRVFNFVFSFS